MKGARVDLYSADQIIDLLGGEQSNLPSWLEWRGKEIWWAKKFSDDDALTDAERAAVRAHPNGNPTTEPLLRERFTVAEFVAFEGCAHVFRNWYLSGPTEVTSSADDQTKHLAVREWTALKGDVAEPIRLAAPRAYALLEALLDRGRSPRRAYVTPQQDAVVLDTLRRLGYDPLKLPRTSGRTPGARSKCWGSIESDRDLLGLFRTKDRFLKVWQRLRDADLIADAQVPAGKR